MWSLRSKIAVCTLALILGCSSSVNRGAALYAQSNYIEAAEVFERTQGRLHQMDQSDRARYGLYRGLTFLALGDLRGAERWLGYAQTQTRSRQTALSDDELALLTKGFSSLDAERRANWQKSQSALNRSVAMESDVSSDESLPR
jgi:tetratricopeptide (TPR) repeat protein